VGGRSCEILGGGVKFRDQPINTILSLIIRKIIEIIATRLNAPNSICGVCLFVSLSICVLDIV